MGGSVIGKAFGIVVIIIFALIMLGITMIVRKIKGERSSVKEETYKKPAKEAEKPKGCFEKYCNEQKNDSRRALANYILIHEDGERKARGQIDDDNPQ